MTDEINRPIFLTHFPVEIKSFYMSRAKDDPRVTEASRLLADLIPRGLLPDADIDHDNSFLRAFYADFAPAQAEAIRRTLRILTETEGEGRS